MSPHALGYASLALLAFADRHAPPLQLALGGLSLLLAVVVLWVGDSRREDTDPAPRTLPVNRRRVDAGHTLRAEAGTTGGAR
jgi:hypothetical protein